MWDLNNHSDSQLVRVCQLCVTQSFTSVTWLLNLNNCSVQWALELSTHLTQLYSLLLHHFRFLYKSSVWCCYCAGVKWYCHVQCFLQSQTLIVAVAVWLGCLWPCALEITQSANFWFSTELTWMGIKCNRSNLLFHTSQLVLERIAQTLTVIPVISQGLWGFY